MSRDEIISFVFEQSVEHLETIAPLPFGFGVKNGLPSKHWVASLMTFDRDGVPVKIVANYYTEPEIKHAPIAGGRALDNYDIV